MYVFLLKHVYSGNNWSPISIRNSPRVLKLLLICRVLFVQNSICPALLCLMRHPNLSIRLPPLTDGYVSVCNTQQDPLPIVSKQHLDLWRKKIRRNVEENLTILKNHQQSGSSVKIQCLSLDRNAIVSSYLILVWIVQSDLPKFGGYRGQKMRMSN